MDTRIFQNVQIAKMTETHISRLFSWPVRYLRKKRPNGSILMQRMPTEVIQLHKFQEVHRFKSPIELSAFRLRVLHIRHMPCLSS
jgi:hypothetical protein